MRRLLISSDNFLPRWDGVSRFLYEIYPYLNKDFEITFVAPKFEGKSTFWNADVIKFPVFKFRVGDFNLARVNPFKIAKAIDDCDIVFNQTIGPIGFWTILIASWKKKPIVTFIHSIEWELVPRSLGYNNFISKILYYVMRFIVKMLYNKVSVIITPTQEVSELLEWQGVNSVKREVVLGVNTEKFKPAVDKAGAKTKIGIDPNCFVIGYSGRLAREKDLHTLYRAFVRLYHKYNNMRLLIVGTGITEFVELFKDKEGIIATGAVNNVPDYLRAMDVFVMSSFTETTSLATMEAMASGVAPVANPVGYIKNYVNHGFNGYIFPQSDSYTLSLYLERLYLSPHLRDMFGVHARKTIVEQYSWEKTAEKISSVLKDPYF